MGEIGRAADRVLPVAHYTAKRRLMPSGFARSTEAEPLRAIYLLSRETASDNHAARNVRIEPLSARDAMIGLVPFAFSIDPADRVLLARQFQSLNKLASAIPIRRLVVPTDFSALPTVHRAVLADLANDLVNPPRG
jgi:hypothetical protein